MELLLQVAVSAFLQENLEESERQRVRGFKFIITINVPVPVVYMRRDVMILIRAISITRALGRGMP
jgi:hypothetical protein